MSDDYLPRRAKPGQTFTITGPNGEQVEIEADDEGVVRPKSAAEQTLADTFGLKVARKAMGEAEEDDDETDQPTRAVEEPADGPADAAAAENGGKG